MMLISRPVIVAAALASLAVAGVARAATDNLSLNGKVADSVFGTASFGGVSYTTWMLPLEGLDVGHSLTVSPGDQININIILDKVFSVNTPASTDLTISDLLLTGSFPKGNTATSGTTHFFDGPIEILGGSAGSVSSNQFLFGAGYGSGFTITFDSISLKYNVTELSDFANVTGAAFYMFAPEGSFGGGGGGGGGGGPVPEPATWSLMLVGFGGLGSALRLRRRTSANLA